MSREFDLSSALQVARRRAWIVAVSIAVAIGSALLVTQLLPSRYEATATVFVGPRVGDDVSTQLQFTSLAQNLVRSYAQLAESKAVAVEAANKAGLSRSLVIGQVKSDSETGVQVLRLTASASIGRRAKRIANAVAVALAERVAGLSGPRSRGVQVQLIDPAVTPRHRDSPRTGLNLFFGGLVGLLFGIGIALLRERGDRRIRTVADAERELGIPVLGVVPSMSGKDGQTDALARHADPKVAEPFRSLALTLASVAEQRHHRRILITSASIEDGSGAVAAHIALSLAEHNRRTALIEGDLRHPSLRRQFPSWDAPSLNEIVRNTNGLGSNGDGVPTSRIEGNGTPPLARCSPSPNLTVLAAEQSGVHDQALLRRPEFTRTLDVVLKENDQVLIEAPSALTASDTALLTRQVDAVLFVVPAGSKTDQAQAALASLKPLGASLVGIVLSRDKPSKKTGDSLHAS